MLRARHFSLRDGEVLESTMEKASQRKISVSYDTDSVTARSGSSVERCHPPRKLVLRSDGRSTDQKLGRIDTNRILSIASGFKVAGLVSIYEEERVVTPSPPNGEKRQSMQFWVARLLEKRESSLYVGRNYSSFKWLCCLQSLPESQLAVSAIGLPVVLGGDVVGHLFHEFAHLLEADSLHTDKMLKVRSAKVFPRAVTIIEDPLRRTVGYNAFSDEGVSESVVLVKNGAITGFLDSFCFPFEKAAFGYIGYGKDLLPKPRTTNLVVEALCKSIAVDSCLVLTDIGLQMKTMDPLESECYIDHTAGIYMENSLPKYRFRTGSSLSTTIRKLVSALTFVRLPFFVPSLGGMCLKNGVAVRSAQSAPWAVFRGSHQERRNLLGV